MKAIAGAIGGAILGSLVGTPLAIIIGAVLGFILGFYAEEGASEMSCPNCGAALEHYNWEEGGYCLDCEEWWPADIVEQHMEENE